MTDLTPRQLRRLQKRLDAQMEQERNGAPIPGEIAARMTKLKDPQQLYQVWAEVRVPSRDYPAGAVIPIGPKMIEDACEALLVAINGQIALGKERLWGNPHVLPCTPL